MTTTPQMGNQARHMAGYLLFDVLAASHELLPALRTGYTDLSMSSWHPDLLLAHRTLEELVLLPMCKALFPALCLYGPLIPGI